MENRQWEVYTLSDPITQMVRYVGVSFRGRARYREHVSRAVIGGKTHRDCWIRSLIDKGMRPQHEVIERGCGEGWRERERYWIVQYRVDYSLTNHTDGGEGAPGYIPSEELKQKWSAMRKGVPYAPGRVGGMKDKRHTSEALQKISEAGMGRKASADTKARIAAAAKARGIPRSTIEASAASRRGKPLSEDTKRLLASSAPNKRPVVRLVDGVEFESVSSAARALCPGRPELQRARESGISLAIRKGCRCQGSMWRRL